MKIRTICRFQLLLLMGLLPLGLYAARVTSDLQTPQKRQEIVDTAERLARRNTPPPVPANLVSPFNPTDFDKVDAPEPQPGSNQVAREDAPPAPLSDRQILDALAVQLTPSGMILRGTPRLVMGSKSFEVGTRFTVTYNNQDYELELVAIDRTTFTLRYRNEETTRPIRSVR